MGSRAKRATNENGQQVELAVRFEAPGLADMLGYDCYLEVRIPVIKVCEEQIPKLVARARDNGKTTDEYLSGLVDAILATA